MTSHNLGKEDGGIARGPGVNGTLVSGMLVSGAGQVLGGGGEAAVCSEAGPRTSHLGAAHSY